MPVPRPPCSEPQVRLKVAGREGNKFTEKSLLEQKC